MKFIREHIIFKFLWLFMALHILNCSVDTPDQRPSHVPEDLSYNDMESVVEIILEQVMGIKNAIAEHDEPGDEENEGLNLKKGLDFFYYQTSLKTVVSYNYISPCKHPIYNENGFKQFCPELTSPPPKA